MVEQQADPKIEITKERQRAETQQMQANVDKHASGPLSANAANESQDRLQPLKYEPPVKEVKKIRVKKEDGETGESEEIVEKEESDDGVPYFEP